jgi:hypothetical protein
MTGRNNSGSAAARPSELKTGSHIDLAGSSHPVGTRLTILLQAFSFSGQELVFRESAFS